MEQKNKTEQGTFLAYLLIPYTAYLLVDLPVVYLLLDGTGGDQAIDKAVVLLPVPKYTAHSLE